MTEVLALSGGIGGAKLAFGLQHVLPPGELTVAVNTGDDFEHLGLAISPDVDTLLYTLSGVSNPELGWGRAGDSWNFMAEIERLGERRGFVWATRTWLSTSSVHEDSQPANRWRRSPRISRGASASSAASCR